MMESKMLRKYMLLITYAAVTLLVVFNFAAIWNALSYFTAFFKPLIIGIVIAFILNGPCMFFDRQLKRWFPPGISRGLAVLFTYIVFVLVLCTIVIFIVPQIIASAQIFVHNLGGYLANSQQLLNRVTDNYSLRDVDLSAYTNQAMEYAKKLIGNLSGLFSSIVGITTGVITFFFNIFLAFIFSTYLLAGQESIMQNTRKVFRTYLPPRLYERLLYVYHVSIDIFEKFVYGQLADAVIIGALCFLGMVILRFDYPVMISTLIGVTALVPLIGAYIGGAVAFLVLLMISPLQALWFLVFLVVLQQIEGNLVYPRVVGGSLGLPGIWVLLATLVGSGLAGPLGILLGVPIATILYTLLKNDVKQRGSMEIADNEQTLN